MSSSQQLEDAVRTAIIKSPDAILDDRDVMQALVAANEQAMGSNIVDLRGIAMERLEARLDRLEDTHRSVIAAAYENLAGTNQVHRAILRMMEPTDFGTFLNDLAGEVADILRVDSIRLVLESTQRDEDPALRRYSDVLHTALPGFVEGYIAQGRSGGLRQVTLRQVEVAEAAIHGPDSSRIRSEACLLLDFGEGRLPGMLVLGATDPRQFTPQHGTDLLSFFCGVFERTMRFWLA